MTYYNAQKAANSYVDKLTFPYGPESRKSVNDAFMAGASWQKEHAAPSPDTVRAVDLVNKAAIDRHNDIRDALGTIGEGMAELLKREAINTASVFDRIKDVGEKVEACMAIANNTEDGLAAAIEKLDKLGVEKWREAIKHVEAEGTTEPMHAEVKAEPVIIESNPEAPGDWVKSAFMRGKVKAQQAVDAFAFSHATARVGGGVVKNGDMGAIRWKGFARNIDPHIGMDLADNRDDKSVIWVGAGGEVRDMGTNSERFRAFDMMSGDTLIWFDGKLYTLEGSSLIPLDNGA